VPLTSASAIKHSPPGRDAMPARPAIRSSSVSSFGSAESVFSAVSASRAAALGFGPGSTPFRRGGGGGAGGAGGAGSQQPPLQLTMELMRSLSPPQGGEAS